MPVTLTFTISFWCIPFVVWTGLAISAYSDLGLEESFKMGFVGMLFMSTARWLP